jgi:hypothetical protein
MAELTALTSEVIRFVLYCLTPVDERVTALTSREQLPAECPLG